jgi:hypothetical protein
MNDNGYDFGASPETKAWGDGRACILFVLGIIIIVLAILSIL